jgi:hypothetical protein
MGLRVARPGGHASVGHALALSRRRLAPRCLGSGGAWAEGLGRRAVARGLEGAPHTGLHGLGAAAAQLQAFSQDCRPAGRGARRGNWTHAVPGSGPSRPGAGARPRPSRASHAHRRGWGGRWPPSPRGGCRATAATAPWRWPNLCSSRSSRAWHPAACRWTSPLAARRRPRRGGRTTAPGASPPRRQAQGPPPPPRGKPVPPLLYAQGGRPGGGASGSGGVSASSLAPARPSRRSERPTGGRSDLRGASGSIWQGVRLGPPGGGGSPRSARARTGCVSSAPWPLAPPTSAGRLPADASPCPRPSPPTAWAPRS